MEISSCLFTFIHKIVIFSVRQISISPKQTENEVWGPNEDRNAFEAVMLTKYNADGDDVEGSLESTKSPLIQNHTKPSAN